MNDYDALIYALTRRHKTLHHHLPFISSRTYIVKQVSQTISNLDTKLKDRKISTRLIHKFGYKPRYTKVNYSHVTGGYGYGMSERIPLLCLATLNTTHKYF